MHRWSFCEWIPILPRPVWPLAGQCGLGQNRVVGSMVCLLLWRCWAACQEGVCQDPMYIPTEPHHGLVESYRSKSTWEKYLKAQDFPLAQGSPYRITKGEIRTLLHRPQLIQCATVETAADYPSKRTRVSCSTVSSVRGIDQEELPDLTGKRICNPEHVTPIVIGAPAVIGIKTDCCQALFIATVLHKCRYCRRSPE